MTYRDDSKIRFFVTIFRYVAFSLIILGAIYVFFFLYLNR